MKQKRETGKYIVFVGVLTAFLVAPSVFAFEAAPLAATLSPNFITEKNAQLNGRVNPNDTPDTYEWFEWGIVGRADIYETNRNNLWTRSTQMDTRATIIGLAPSTQYFYRQVTENSRGKNIGATVYFTTKPLPLPTLPIAIIETDSAVFVSDTEVTLRGYMSPHGNTHTKTWFEWGTTRTMENRTPEQGTAGDSTSISTKLNGLIPGSLYYFRAAAENEQGRSYGALKTFSTTGLPPVVLSTEAPRNQYVSPPINPSGDIVSRKVTTSGESVPRVSTNELPRISYRPGDFLGAFLRGKEKTDTQSTSVADTSSMSEDGDHGEQVAGVGVSSGIFTNLWSLFTGKKSVEVVVEKVGPESIRVHTPVEYRIAYAYRESSPASDARLKITLPGDVIYIGDNTNNELLLETGSGPERTYVLPVDRIENGSTRAISILGMTTGDAKGFPDARVRLEYTNGSGTHVVAATNGRLSGEGKSMNTASVGNAKNDILPSSFLGWFAYVLVIVAAILGIRKAKAYYVKRKETIALAAAKTEEENEQSAQFLQFLPGAKEVTMQ